MQVKLSMTANMDLRQQAKERLESHGIRPSVQRLQIMEYLLCHNTHPSVEEVFVGLLKEIPTLSRTTVYNTLRLFSEQGAAQMITIDEHRVCYDGHIHNHGHFYCRQCGCIIDMEIPAIGIAMPKPASVPGVGEIDEVQFYYRGLCSKCASRQQKAQNEIKQQ